MCARESEFDEVLICRCREVSRGQVQEAIANGAKSLQDIKNQTQAMTGLCQGRTCCREIARELARAGVEISELVPRHARLPVRPVPLDALADETPENNTG